MSTLPPLPPSLLAEGPPPSLSFGEAVQAGLKKYLVFVGRASRSEFWWFVLFQWLTLISLAILLPALFGESDLIYSLLSLALLVLIPPGLAVGVRRLHDTGRAGTWMFLVLVPFGGLILLFLLAGAGDPHRNAYG